MTDLSVPEVLAAAKDFTLSGGLMVALWGVLTGKWVPGSVYAEAVKRAEREAEKALLAHDAAARATVVSEQLLSVLRERGGR